MGDNFKIKFKKCEKDLLKANHDLDMLYEKYDTKTSELKQRIRDLEANNTRNNTNENITKWIEMYETLLEEHDSLKESKEELRLKYNELVNKYNKDMEDRRIERNQIVELYNNLSDNYNNLSDNYNKNLDWIELAKKELTKCGYVILNPPPKQSVTTTTATKPAVTTTTAAKPAATTTQNAKPAANQKCEGSDCTIMGGKKRRKTNRYRKRNKISRKQKK